MVLARSLLFFLSLVITTLFFSTPLILLGWAMPYRWNAVIANAWGLSNLKLLAWICRLGYQVQGWENIPEGGVIVMSKHQSAWETIALRGLLRPEQTWVLKRELMWTPIFGWALAAAEPIAINRKAGRQAVREIVEQGTRRLEAGRTVIIFPEGTRVAPGQRKRYGIGGALLAHHSGFPIVPVAHNAGVFWRRRGLRKYPGTIQVVLGPLIHTDGLSAPEIIHAVEDWIETTMERLPQLPKEAADD
jgi:1-acyl-sn-glycerol-3-phosphate acyltransferase